MDTFISCYTDPVLATFIFLFTHYSDEKYMDNTLKTHPRFFKPAIFLSSYERKTPWFRSVPCTSLGVLLTGYAHVMTVYEKASRRCGSQGNIFRPEISCIHIDATPNNIRVSNLSSKIISTDLSKLRRRKICKGEKYARCVSGTHE